MSVALHHFNQHTQAVEQTGFAPNAWEMIRIAFNTNPPPDHFDILKEATEVTRTLYYSRIKNDERGMHIVYHNDLKKLKGELNERYGYQFRL